MTRHGLKRFVEQIEQAAGVAVLPASTSLVHDVAPADFGVGIGEGE